MKFLSIKCFKKEDIYYCCSKNLYNFLLSNDIQPVFSKYIKKNIKHNINNNYVKYIKCYYFVKCEKLQQCLTKWSNNKLNGTLYFPEKSG